MKILGIETSCDETAIAIVEAKEGNFDVLSHALYSQAKKHAKYGGVYPSLAKREHAKNLVPLLKEALKDAGLYKEKASEISKKDGDYIEKTLSREPHLSEDLIPLLSQIDRPNIDLISVTQGPGLEPALWVGLNFAKILSIIWNIPLIPTNHMEGHIVSVLLNKDIEVDFPVLALLVSGGHTELVLVKKWNEYEKIGQTLDDAAGEAFDKVARMLDLPYPGGPEISKLAEEDRKKRNTEEAVRFNLPRPMLDSNDLNFSYSGLKTAVLYKINDIKSVTDKDRRELAREFEDAVTESLLAKTKKALEKCGANTLILAGGVIANKHIRNTFQGNLPDINILMPTSDLATDNAVMIAVSGYLHRDEAISNPESLRALGNLSL